jgi:hypothetical protein
VDFGTTKNGLIFNFVAITSISVGCISTYINVGVWHIYWYSFLLFIYITIGCVPQAAALESLDCFLLGVELRKL